MDILTCAAPILNWRPSNDVNIRGSVSKEALRRLQKKRIRRVLDLAAEQGAEVLVLGAFGCGAFRNPPKTVAAAMRDALRDYRQCFETVEIAVYCARGGMRTTAPFLRYSRNHNP
ncbi:MAG: TIGR02452 family protein [Oscillospiraceae bacterium]|nr:TIGR02452 family protein [Oscillospiraceae bacterium]